MSARDELEELCEKSSGFIDVYSSEEVMLDGDFTVQELKKLLVIMEKLSYEED